jgi:cytochrome c peroxidase
LLRPILLGLTIVTRLVGADFDWNLPKGFPRPAVPADNPMSAAKVDLGRHLFYDKRLSVNGTESCATCHRQRLAFTDGLAHARGATGKFHPRSSMSLANVGYAPSLTWADPALTRLEDQALIPMLGDTPVELGLKNRGSEILALLHSDSVYRDLFPRAFPGESDPYNLSNTTKALAAFERLSAIALRSLSLGRRSHCALRGGKAR